MYFIYTIYMTYIVSMIGVYVCISCICVYPFFTGKNDKRNGTKRNTADRSGAGH